MLLSPWIILGVLFAAIVAPAAMADSCTYLFVGWIKEFDEAQG
jgi:hypothetical protein